MPPFLKYDSAKRHGQNLLIKELESKAFSPPAIFPKSTRNDVIFLLLTFCVIFMSRLSTTVLVCKEHVC